jgi:hypothetical protein
MSRVWVVGRGLIVGWAEGGSKTAFTQSGLELGSAFGSHSQRVKAIAAAAATSSHLRLRCQSHWDPGTQMSPRGLQLTPERACAAASAEIDSSKGSMASKVSLQTALRYISSLVWL